MEIEKRLHDAGEVKMTRYFVEYRWWAVVEAEDEDEAKQRALREFEEPDVSELSVSVYDADAIEESDKAIARLARSGVLLG